MILAIDKRIELPNGNVRLELVDGGFMVLPAAPSEWVAGARLQLQRASLVEIVLTNLKSSAAPPQPPSQSLVPTTTPFRLSTSTDLASVLDTL